MTTYTSETLKAEISSTLLVDVLENKMWWDGILTGLIWNLKAKEGVYSVAQLKKLKKIITTKYFEMKKERPEEFPPAGEGSKKAMQKLRAKYPNEIRLGKYFVVQHALANRTVHSRNLWEILLARKFVNKKSESPHWMGTVFSDLRDEGILEKTSEYHSYSDPARNINERTVAVWQLRKDVDEIKLKEYREEPAITP